MAEETVELWAFGIPEIHSFTLHPVMRAKQQEALAYIMGQEGFAGFYPTEADGHRVTLAIYRTENDAKIARNQLYDRGCPVSQGVGAVNVSLADYESLQVRVKGFQAASEEAKNGGPEVKVRLRRPFWQRHGRKGGDADGG